MPPKIFQFEREGPVFVISPQRNISSLADESLQNELAEMLQQLAQTDAPKVLVDFSEIEYFGSSMLETLRHLYNRVSQGEGILAVCGLSDIGRKVMQVTQFDTIWPIYESRSAALLSLKQ